MCKHYTEEQRAAKFAAAHAGIEHPPEMPERSEIWPKRRAHILVQTDAGRAFAHLRWGVWPFYAREKARFLHNARDDSLLTKSIWKQAVAHRRCLIPAAAYFEPGLGPEGARGEARFTLRGRPAFFIAGLWDHDPDGSGNQAFTMVTTAPNDYVSRYQDRMPVVLSDADALRWLGHEPLAANDVLALCQPCRADVMEHIDIPAPTIPIRKADLTPRDGELQLE